MHTSVYSRRAEEHIRSSRIDRTHMTTNLRDPATPLTPAEDESTLQTLWRLAHPSVDSALLIIMGKLSSSCLCTNVRLIHLMVHYVGLTTHLF